MKIEKQEPKKYEETKDSKTIIDWEKVWSEHPYTREKMLRGVEKLPLKKVENDA